jgi:DNA-binding YbaB/EbfC family protein
MAFDMMGMMGKVKELQDKMQQAQAQLQHLTATGEAGGGLVKATANGHRLLTKLEIDPSLLTPEDREQGPRIGSRAGQAGAAAPDQRPDAQYSGL